MGGEEECDRARVGGEEECDKEHLLRICASITYIAVPRLEGTTLVRRRVQLV